VLLAFPGRKAHGLDSGWIRHSRVWTSLALPGGGSGSNAQLRLASFGLHLTAALEVTAVLEVTPGRVPHLLHLLRSASSCRLFRQPSKDGAPGGVDGIRGVDTV
jgi:hypothetical protein